MKLSLIAILFLLASASLSLSAQNDSIADTLIYSWSVSQPFFLKDSVPIDSSIHQAQIYSPINPDGYHSAYCSNIGSPAVSQYHLRNQKRYNDFLFINYNIPYIRHYNDQVYFNTRKPYSNLLFISSLSGKEQLEQILRLTHSQNINKKLNAGFVYDMISSRGQYQYQHNRKGSFSFFSSYNGNNYDLYVSANINTLKLQKNGGIDVNFYNSNNDKSPREMLTLLSGNPSDNLAYANEILKNRNISVLHRKQFGREEYTKTVFDTVRRNDSVIIDTAVIQQTIYKNNWYVGHHILFETYDRTFTDVAPSLNYYGNVFNLEIDTTYSYTRRWDSLALDSVTDTSMVVKQVGSSQTFDSAHYRNFKNTVYLGFDDFLNLRGSIGITQELKKYSYFNHFPVEVSDTIHSDAFQDFTAHVNLMNIKNLWRWKMRSSYCFVGYKRGEVMADLSLSKKIRNASWIVDAIYMNEVPGYFYKYYNSNHTFWEINDFKNPIRKHVGFKYVNNRIDLVVGNYFEDTDNQIFFRNKSYLSSDGNYLNFTRQLFFDENNNTFSDLDGNTYTETKEVRPVQSLGGYKIYCFYLQKRISLWKFYSLNRLTWQNIIGDESIRLPAVVFFNSTFIDFNVYFKLTGGSLRMQLGTDVYYVSAYKGYGYLPVVNQFYVQNTGTTGGIPVIDAFINLKIKRSVMFFKMQHANYSSKKTNNVSVWHYPMNINTLKFGISWNFYN
jgi:hypothetical protein